MAEDEISHEQLEAFREEFRGHLGDALFIVGTEQETAFPIDTLSFDMGEETEAELPNSFRAVLRATLYESIGISPTDKPEPISTYTLDEDDETGRCVVKVFSGSFENPETGEAAPIFLHEVVSSTRELSWLIANTAEVLPELQAPKD